MTASKSFSAPPDIVTKAELEQRRARRTAPAPERHLTPDSWEAHSIKTQSAVANEQRITHIERRLNTMQERAERAHSFARLHGRAKADFGRCD